MDAVVESSIIENQLDKTWGSIAILDGRDSGQNVVLKIERQHGKKPSNCEDGYDYDGKRL
jgi:hypothetical protein